MSNAQREQNRITGLLALNASTDELEPIKVDPANNRVLMKDMGGFSAAPSMIPPKEDANRVHSLPLVNDVDGETVLSARCTPDGYLLVKII